MGTSWDDAIQEAMRIGEMRARLADAEQRLNEMRPGGAVAPAATREHITPADLVRKQSPSDGMPQKVLGVLRADPARVFEAPEVAAALAIGDDKLNDVRSVLSRLCKRGKIRKMERGRYQALAQSKE